MRNPYTELKHAQHVCGTHGRKVVLRGFLRRKRTYYCKIVLHVCLTWIIVTDLVSQTQNSRHISFENHLLLRHTHTNMYTNLHILYYILFMFICQKEKRKERNLLIYGESLWVWPWYYISRFLFLSLSLSPAWCKSAI